MGVDVLSVEASTGGRQLERLNGEGEVLVVGVVDEEPVVDALLQTLGLVTRGHQRTRLTSCLTLLNSTTSTRLVQ